MQTEGKYDKFFQTDGLSQNLRRRSVRGGAVTLSAQGCKFVLGLASTAVLARLLTPDDFGLIAMVLVLTAFVDRFKDMGLAMSTVQRAEINHRQVSTLFWVNVGFGVLITLATMSLAPVVAWFYGDPRLTNVTLVLACAFIFGSLTVQHQALLRRQMRFSALATIEVVSLFLGVTAAVVAAWAEIGYWALVVQQVVTVIATMFAVWLLCGWRPGRPVRHAGVGPMLAFGGHLAGANLLNYVVRNLDNLLIGWRCGAGPLGIYSKAYQLLLLPIQLINSPVSGVAVPILSRLQDKPDQFRATYRKAIQMLVSIGMPIVAFMFVAADGVVLVVLGEQWLETVPIFRMLAPAAFVGTFNVATGWVFISLGQTDRQFRWGLLSTAVMSCGFVVGLHWGPIGVAAACSIVMCGLRLPALIYCFRRAPVGISDLFGALWRPALTSVTAAAGLYLTDTFVSFDTIPVAALLFDMAVYTLLYAASWLIVPSGRRTIQEIRVLAKELTP